MEHSPPRIAVEHLYGGHAAGLLEGVLRARVGASIVATDLDGTITYVSRGAQALLGPRADGLLGRRPTAFRGWCEPSGERAAAPHDGPTAAPDGPCEWSFLDADGQDVTLAMEFTPVPGGDGETVGYASVATDVTELRQGQRLMGQALLRETDAVRGVHAVEVAKRDFLATASHELRTPLANMLGYTELLHDGAAGPLNEAQALLVARVQTGVDRMRGLVEDLLTLVRVESEAFAVANEEVDLNDVVRRAFDMTRSRLDRPDLRLELSLDPSEPVVSGAAGELELVVTNLLSNAAKFTPDGGRVRVSTDRSGTQCRIVVTDTGIGIPAAERDLVFDPFVRSSTALEQATQGSGVGLSVVRAIVRAHLGDITVQTNRGGGTVFAVLLPAWDPDPDPDGRRRLSTVQAGGACGRPNPGWVRSPAAPSLRTTSVPETHAAPVPSDAHAGPVVSHRLVSEAELRDGLDHDQLIVHYQPVVDLADRQFVGFEALVRWQHPRLGLLFPDAFIGLAEESGLIVELGAQVLDKACRQAATWLRGGADISMSINVSGAELGDPSFTGRVADTLARSGLDPRRLWLEVTETALVEDLEQVRLRLARLVDLGIGIAIDDFGTGWAGLLYLRQLPVGALKIDRVFVSGTDPSASDVAIARSVLSLGADLDLVVVAEGVETLAQELRLQQLGCRFLQGYLYGMPTSADDVPLAQVRRLVASAPGNRPPAFDSASQGLPPQFGSDRRGGPTSMLPGGAEDTPAQTMLRGLLRIRSAADAAGLLQAAATAYGGSLVAATDASDDALPLDLALGEGAPVLVEAEPLSLARLHLEQFLPRLAEDARQAIDLLRHHERLEDASKTDRLTGLGNRRVLDDVLAKVEAGAVVLVDLDHFKQVNDTAGHHAGDVVLADFGGMLDREVRASDTCCRIGGEEFVVVFPGTTVRDAVRLVSRLRQAWLEVAPRPVTFSAGVAAIGAAGGVAALAAADRALYAAKDLGRNRTEIEPGR